MTELPISRWLNSPRSCGHNIENLLFCLHTLSSYLAVDRLDPFLTGAVLKNTANHMFFVHSHLLRYLDLLTTHRALQKLHDLPLDAMLASEHSLFGSLCLHSSQYEHIRTSIAQAGS